MTNYSLFFGVFDILIQVKLNLKEIFTDAKWIKQEKKNDDELYTLPITIYF